MLLYRTDLKYSARAIASLSCIFIPVVSHALCLSLEANRSRESQWNQEIILHTSLVFLLFVICTANRETFWVMRRATHHQGCDAAVPVGSTAGLC